VSLKLALVLGPLIKKAYMPKGGKCGDDFVSISDLYKEDYFRQNKRLIKTEQTSLSDSQLNTFIHDELIIRSVLEL
jgi:hypothetical protein